MSVKVHDFCNTAPQVSKRANLISLAMAIKMQSTDNPAVRSKTSLHFSRFVAAWSLCDLNISFPSLCGIGSEVLYLDPRHTPVPTDLCTGSQAFGALYRVEVEGSSLAPEVLVYDSACYACSMSGPSCSLKDVRPRNFILQCYGIQFHVVQ